MTQAPVPAGSVGRVRTGVPPLGDVVLAAVLTALTLFTVAGGSSTAHTPAAAAVAVLTIAPLAWRQLAPLVTSGIVLVALAAFGLLGFGDFPNGGCGMFLAVFSVATLRSRRSAAVVYGASVVVLLLADRTSTTPILWSELVQAIVLLLGAWVLGEATRRWVRRAELAAAESAAAVADERVRIARELHDIVAHHMSVISLQSGVAEYVIEDDPDTAKAAIADVTRSGHEALQDMRRMLDVLRLDDSGAEDLAPQPGLAQLEDLVARTEAAGLVVETTQRGAPRALSAGLDLCSYRVIQESLTNVLKHARAETAQVVIDYAQDSVRVSVADDGTGPRSAVTHAGSLGIRGMRERAELYGGTLEAGHRGARGFEVRLRLPLDEAR